MSCGLTAQIVVTQIQSLEASLLLNEFEQVRLGILLQEPARILSEIEPSKLIEARADYSVDQLLLFLRWLIN